MGYELVTVQLPNTRKN